MPELILGPIIGGLSYTARNSPGKPGAKDTQTAKFWGRADGEGTLYAWVSTKSDLSDLSAPSGQPEKLTSGGGYTGVAQVSGLLPDTKYYYALTLKKTVPNPKQAPIHSFHTFPEHGKKESFSFAFGSCFLPDDEDDGQIYDSIRHHRVSPDMQKGLSFILLMGDQIYADNIEKNSLGRIASSEEDYRAVYEYNWKRASFRKLLWDLPAYMTLDDHEVDDDWHWTDYERNHAAIPIWNRALRWLKRQHPTNLSRERALAALKVCREHQGIHSPKGIGALSGGADLRRDKTGRFTFGAGDEGSMAYTFEYGAAAFFVLDTRTHRVRPRPSERWKGSRRTILGKGQWAALEEWLSRVKDEYPVKFLVTSSALLSRLWVDLLYDRWGGFPEDRNHLFDLLAEKNVEGLYILSGDIHAAHAVYAEIKGKSGNTIPVWEFCSTPFKQKPNKIARRAFYGFPFGPIRKIQRKFCVAEHNYGVVNVNFENGKPAVCFAVFDTQGKRLEAVSKITT